MPVFRNSKERIYALVSYKVLYSKFRGAENWQELGLCPTPRLLARSILKDRAICTLFVVRSPYGRVVSCFLDKFRKQPTRINEPVFEWQACHEVMYDYCGICATDSHAEKASKFRRLTFDNFIDILPAIYMRDPHFQPQSWSRRLYVGHAKAFNWPNCRIVKMEHSDELSRVPDIDWSVRANSTSHIEPDFCVTEKHKSAIRQVYKEDFQLGGYTP